MRPGKMYFAIVPPGGFRNCESNESVSGTSTVIWLPLMPAITRSVLIVEPGEIQVCGWPLRTSVSIPMKCTQAAVTGRMTSTLSPTLKSLESSTVNEAVPDATYGSTIDAARPNVCHEPDPRISRNRCGLPVTLTTVPSDPEPLPRSTTPLVVIVTVPATS